MAANNSVPIAAKKLVSCELPIEGFAAPVFRAGDAVPVPVPVPVSPPSSPSPLLPFPFPLPLPGMADVLPVAVAGNSVCKRVWVAFPLTPSSSTSSRVASRARLTTYVLPATVTVSSSPADRVSPLMR